MFSPMGIGSLLCLGNFVGLEQYSVSLLGAGIGCAVVVTFSRDFGE